jgi:hypothetical protein
MNEHASMPCPTVSAISSSCGESRLRHPKKASKAPPCGGAAGGALPYDALCWNQNRKQGR